MANEIELAGSFKYSRDGAMWQSPEFAQVMANIIGAQFIHHKQSIGFAAEEALVLGEVAGSPGYFIFINWDAVATVTIRTATGAGKGMLEIEPMTSGIPKFAIGKFPTDVTAPFAIATPSAALLEYFIAIR